MKRQKQLKEKSARTNMKWMAFFSGSDGMPGMVWFKTKREFNNWRKTMVKGDSVDLYKVTYNFIESWRV